MLLPELNVFDQLFPLALEAVVEVTSDVHEPPTGRRSKESVRFVSGLW